MRSILSRRGVTLLSASALRFSSTNDTSSSTIAPKRQKRKIVPPKVDTTQMMKEMPSDPGAHARLSTEELERKVEELSKLSPEELEEVIRKLESDEEESSRVLADDSIYQMDVSLKPRASGAVRVFWKDVDVEEVKDYPGWYCVTVDGRKVKAFESSNILAVPSEAMALCCAQEYAEQTGYINKLLMPMSDMCSGALHVAPQMIPPRIDYLMTFFQNDNLYFRSAAIADEQDRMIQPIVDWFEATYDIAVPRIVGIGYPNITPHAVQKMRQHLLSLAMNPYQVVAFCVAAQFTSSLLLPLAMFNGVVDLPTGLRINRAEELHNINEAGMIEGYHDIREADAVTKICACVTSWKIMKDVPLSKCLEVPRASGDLDDVDAA